MFGSQCFLVHKLFPFPPALIVISFVNSTGSAHMGGEPIRMIVHTFDNYFSFVIANF